MTRLPLLVVSYSYRTSNGSSQELMGALNLPLGNVMGAPKS